MWFLTNRGMRRTSTDRPAESWIKSSRSMANSNCIEVRGLSGELVQVRDSKNPMGAPLGFTPTQWTAFLGGVRNDTYPRP
jgi:Domain of unknown function (DUF397)